MYKYRQTSIKNNLVLRSRIIQAIRQFFIENDYLEVQTPTRIPAPAPEVHIDAQSSGEWFLQTSPELCMKHLLAAGFPRIFQICPCFRQGERGRKHLPEFTMLEWYAAGINYNEMMTVCENLVRAVAKATGFGNSVTYQGRIIDLGKTWKRLSVEAAFEKYASVSLDEAICSDTFDEVMTAEIEPCLGIHTPLFLYDYPAQRAALAKLKAGNPKYGERFELYIHGVEICNAFTELIDAEEQKHRFKQEAIIRSQLKKTAYPLPEKFLDMLPDMPEASGNALGIDRLVMVFADVPEIDDITAFTPEEL